MNKIFEFKQEDKIANDYGRIGLKANPFPMGGQPSKEDPYIPVSSSLAKNITDFVNSITISKKWQGMSIIGDNGTGKTRLMFSIESNINSQLKFSNAIYVNDPPADPIKFFQKIILSCNLESLTELVLTESNLLKPLLEIIMKHLNITLMLSGAKKAAINNESKLVNAVSELLSEYITNDMNLNKAYSILIIHYLITNKLKQDGIEMLIQDFWITEVETVKRYISGENTSSQSLEKLGMKLKKIDVSDMEKLLFPTFIEYNKLGGKKIVYALIDEFQFVIDNVSKAKIISILNTIISVTQSNQIGFCMVLACLPDSWIYATRLSNSFSERFSNQINMPTLSKDIAGKMVIEYLKVARISQSNNTIEPFTKPAINEILAISSYNIRKFLHFLGLTLNLFVSEGKGELIEESFVKDAFKTLKQSNEYILWESGKS